VAHPLRSLQRVGIPDCEPLAILTWIVPQCDGVAALQFKHAEGPEALLRARVSPLSHLQLLPSPALAGQRAPPRLVCANPRAGSSALWFRGRGLCGHAGPHSSADQRTAAGHAVHRDAGFETALRAAGAGKQGKHRAGKLWPDEPQHVWQRRFYDFHVWSERKRVEKLRYMHRNPVKDGLVQQPEHMDVEQLPQLRLQ
jgi:hypothetical protein